ncbi:flap endonuclease GEN homolog 1 isoform X2 [Syngnathoides biaculeatus]|uniref:flap endonuclease GEN homolog 1 isoform X2 n=1 Tax=Syngnathoides biaculeatus TaxID=300417 RepID=UPI002ADD3FC2|nr:flap endonuclease GEN homolog 1 isoform X2 [Syngnathoides biaculeatus]
MPVRESVPLYSLSGKTLAVDLSLWVCEAQHVQAMMGRVTKPHLRNLFFRVSSLVLMGVKLVFVMEGEAPKLKAETMIQRTANRYGGPPKASKSSTNTSRGRFNAVLRECAEMLDYLGVPWVVAAGEAEAMCAHLDSQGLVDGCITNDGDVFLYGARTVYRNFNINSKDPQVDCYKTSRVQTELRLSRENLVGLAILLGCDYIPKGIPGVGKELALKLIQTIKGETLLQRFVRWKDEMASVSQGAAKKLPHCNICRHPGSAKGHERGGCVFCDSRRFCQPQDFDYPCPCDWHRSEQTRQAQSIEANIKKKTLASQRFPFTEIIHEFLISKEKPVGNFKRRQPNMLSMQKFALDKMEWPKHYTSEKVLVLMTYTELMNRKCGRIMSPQIKPIRISKQRVRNSVSCFEVIWSTPDHYVFPEDRPAEDQLEVTSVEEESLFRVAFPEVVERYLKEKASAEEKKFKKRKAKSKMEKTPEEADVLLDLLAQMTLQLSPPEKAKPQTLHSVHPQMSEVVLLDTPVTQKQHRGLAEKCPGTPLSQPDPSPSVSATIDALHLSDIDWDALSFTATPPPQTVPKCPPKNAAMPVGDVVGAEAKTSKTQHSDAAPELCFTEYSLTDRLLMRNTSTATEIHEKQLGYLAPILKPTADARKESFGIKISGGATPAVQSQTKLDKRPPHKYKFVSAAAAKLQRCHSEPCQAEKNRKATGKKSVCTRVCSSSEDSDAENQQHAYNPERGILSDPPPKLVRGPLKTTSERVQSSNAKRVANGDHVTHLQSKTEVEAHADVVFPPAPASPCIGLDGDDSVVCVDSPLPLAERLKLKFLK